MNIVFISDDKDVAYHQEHDSTHSPIHILGYTHDDAKAEMFRAGVIAALSYMEEHCEINTGLSVFISKTASHIGI